MDEELLVGIDIGTSSAKIAVFNHAGAVVEQDTGEYPTYYPAPGWAEQDPQDWWQVVCAALQRIAARKKIKLEAIKGIGIDGQSWSAIPMGADGTVLGRTPIWMDTRAQEICDRVRQTIGEERIFAVSGNAFYPTYSLPKILWLKENAPDTFAKTAQFLQSNSYLVYQLTGQYSQDLSQSYGLHFFNMQTGAYDAQLCADFGLSLALFPPLYQCDDVVGTVTPAAAAQTGLPAGIPVVAGGLDAACGALGVGVINAGQTQEQGGQAGGMSVCLDDYHADARLILSRHVVADKWLLQGGTVGGAGVARWFLRTLGQAETDAAANNGTNAYHELDITARDTPAGANGLLFLPYMAGERSPIWNAQAKGVYYGLDFAKTRGEIIRASYEGVAYSLAHNLKVAEAAGVQIDDLYAMGGAANSAFWMQIKADVTQRTIQIPAADHATTLGAALLAGVAVGMYPSYQAAVGALIQVKQTYHPRPETKAVYENGFNQYLALYDALKPMMV
ncbi:FGGY-family carbohydrate kinase [Lacticaseibacillus baoqingensis]|uniref:FGGY-family carbohydrate kinase n=1 Tax=Lacticaseibacillus baoqingensis TaxID=2486013 RepID=A0ABW4E2R8_9LACO|nr:FGGY-family carbohydrate kinase [Lacticaseibacillus baoqingensis]